MRKLDINEYKLCQMHARFFESSIDYASFSSPMFIRRFMMSDLAVAWDTKQYLIMSTNLEDSFEKLNEQYKKSTKSLLYSKNEMYWLGYLYRAMVCLYGLSSKTVYKMFPAPKLRSYYAIYHTFDIEEAAERLIETTEDYKIDITAKGVKILRCIYANEKQLEKI